MIDKINKLKEKKFKSVPYNQRIIFIPHCLRSTECPAKNSEDGILCINCGRCNIGPFKEKAEAKGYKVFIVPGYSLIKKLIEKYEPKAMVGISCKNEMEMAQKKLKDRTIQGILLTKDGCVNTEVDWDEVEKICFNGSSQS